MHNKWRSEIAWGNIKHYDPATHMAKMTWDSELAELAERHAKSCEFAHDKCYNRNKFDGAIPNIGVKILLNTKPTPQKPMVGHFRNFVQDKVEGIGCAMSIDNNDQGSS
ncbi:antigen 5 like allergen Cul n 1-like [Sitodiplosis mosellana]|uniref:antigen 5 like allergen Cul n 1-like n=1 Tax=Sitodiplosis mosellana TaxID=263140 RepID=UPI002444F07C|nr:antigen 5 like allergen Cul n 1-like [Sitodiplosis mosellana]